MTDYATLDEAKAALKIPLDDTTDDVEIARKLTTASRRVDDDTGRNNGIGFSIAADVGSKIYRPVHPELLTVADIATETGLVVEIGRGSSWTTLDPNGYDLLPENAIAEGKAIECIQRVAFGCWPMWGSTRVRVTAKWGWPAVPSEIKDATLLLLARLFRRKDSPEGVAGFGDSGAVRVGRYDPDYDSLIGPYRREVR